MSNNNHYYHHHFSQQQQQDENSQVQNQQQYYNNHRLHHHHPQAPNKSYVQQSCNVGGVNNRNMSVVTPNITFQNFGGFGSSTCATTGMNHFHQQQQQQQTMIQQYQHFGREALADRTNFNFGGATAAAKPSDFSFYSNKPYQFSAVPTTSASSTSTRTSATNGASSKKKLKKKQSQKKKIVAPNFPTTNDVSLMEEDSLNEDDAETLSSSSQQQQKIQVTEDQLIKHFGCPYIPEINTHMKQTEANHKAGSSYMTMQSDINATMRGILVDWLVEVCGEFTLLPETLYLAVNITDRTLAKFAISRNKLQMIGVTALFIASKYFEMEPPSVDEFVFITDNTYQKDDILKMESQILNALDFDLTVVTNIDFLDRYLKAARASDVASDMAHFLSELTLQEYRMIGYLPSAVAASCVILASYCLNAKEVWTTSLKQLTGFEGPELVGCIQEIVSLLNQLTNSPLTAVKEKYSSEGKNRVSVLPYRSELNSLLALFNA